MISELGIGIATLIFVLTLNAFWKRALQMISIFKERFVGITIFLSVVYLSVSCQVGVYSLKNSVSIFKWSVSVTGSVRDILLYI